MKSNLRYALVALKEGLLSGGPLVLLAAGLMLLALWWLNPNPPRHVVLAAGPAQSAYAEFAKAYAQALADEGITVDIVTTDGSNDNLQRLRDDKADIGFVQGGGSDLTSDDAEDLVSLGSLFYEPVWLFYREDAALRRTGQSQLSQLPQLRQMRVDVGPVGSGVPELMRKLFAVNRLDANALALSHLAPTEAVQALLAGRIDAMVVTFAPEAATVQKLLRTPGVRLFEFVQNEAYARRFPFLSAVHLPRGVVDLATDLPPRPVPLLSTTTTLMAQEDLHPALLQLFAQASRRIHGDAGWFNGLRQFPNAEHAEVPLSKEAERLLRNGSPWLQHYLPFWVANWIDRMALALGLIAAALLPLSRIVPPLYTFRIRSRIFRWYGQLRSIEDRMTQHRAPGSRPAAGWESDLLAELEAMDVKVSKVSVPLSYAEELYALRNHIAWVRAQLTSGPASPGASGADMQAVPSP